MIKKGLFFYDPFAYQFACYKKKYWIQTLLRNFTLDCDRDHKAGLSMHEWLIFPCASDVKEELVGFNLAFQNLLESEPSFLKITS